MKYLKLFENSKNEYKIGDYVQVLSSEFHGKIIDIDKDDRSFYDVITPIGGMWITKNQITRKLNDEEIKICKRELTIQKYNIKRK